MAIGFALLGAAAGCGAGATDTARPATPTGRLTLSDIQNFDGYAVYSAGSSFEGKTITSIQRIRSPRTSQPFTASATPPKAFANPSEPDLTSISYGTCTPVGENGCPIPLSITSSSYCGRPIDKSAIGGTFVYRGARAAWISGGLVLFFRDSTVSVIAAILDSRATEMRVADQLIAENANLVPGARTSASEDFGDVAVSC